MTATVGFAIREQNRTILDDPAIDAAEITFERADDPLRTGRYLADAEFAHVSIHALKLSVASPDPPRRSYLEAIQRVAAENDAQSISDHLGFTRSGDGGHEIGHFAPPPYTPEALDACCRNLELIQSFFAPRQFFLENIAYNFQWQSEWTEAEFLSRLLRRSGCGWLLDITNVHANSLNFGFDAAEFIEHVLPAAESLQIHLAGGFFDEQAGLYVDSHSHPIPDEVWHLYERVIAWAGEKLVSVFIERDQNFPDDAGWRAEVRKARRLLETGAAV